MYSYETYLFGDKEAYTGPSDLTQCICRFCGKSFPDVRFKKKNAHAIPDSMGNKLVFCNDECETCNNDLSPVDKELGEYLKLRRSIYKIRNKKNKIITVWGHNFTYDGTTEKLRISDLAILRQNDRLYFLKFEGADLITHLGIYKSLAKIAIDLMPRNLVSKYDATVKWIKGEFIPRLLPDVFYAYREQPINQPLATVFVRKPQLSGEIHPQCIVAITVTDLTYFYIVPLGDGEPMFDANALLQYLPMLISAVGITGKTVVERLDMADRIGKFSHVKDWMNKEDCEIVDRSTFDHTQEKNPNIVEFPPFDSSLISDVTTRITIKSETDDFGLAESLRIEDSYVKLSYKKLRLNPQLKCGVFVYEINIYRLQGQQSVLTARLNIKFKHRKLSQVSSVKTGELSTFLVYYILNVACIELGRQKADKFPKYDFSQLADFLMESEGHIMHPKAGTEQSVIKRRL